MKPSSLDASTKKFPKPKKSKKPADNKSKGTDFPIPKGKSDEDIEEAFEKEAVRNFGPVASVTAAGKMGKKSKKDC